MAQFQAAAREAIAGIEARGHRALLVGGPGLYYQVVVDDFELPGEDRALRAELYERGRPAGRAGALMAELAELDPSRRAASTRETRDGRARPRGDPGQRAAVLLVRSRRVRRRMAGLPVAAAGSGVPRPRPPGASRPASAPWSTPAWSTKSGGWPPRPAACRAPPGRGSGTRRSWTTWRDPSPPWRRRCDGPPIAPGSSPGGSACGSAATGASPGSAAPEIRSQPFPPFWQRGSPSRWETLTTLHFSKLHATGNDFLVLIDLEARFGSRGRNRLAPGAAGRALRPAPGCRRRRAHPPTRRRATAPTARWS